jgi:hypothetical protein
MLVLVEMKVLKASLRRGRRFRQPLQGLGMPSGTNLPRPDFSLPGNLKESHFIANLCKSATACHGFENGREAKENIEKNRLLSS